MKFEINIDIPEWAWFFLHLILVTVACITIAVLDDRGLIPWNTFTVVEEILAIFVCIVVFGGGIISVTIHFFEVTY